MLQAVPPMSSNTASHSGILPTRPTHPLPDSARPILGTLDRYRLSCLLGRGGMAEVFLAAWRVAPEVVRPVVVKRLYGHFSEDQSLVRMFVDEARLVCQLDHDNIVKTYEIGLIDGHLCIAMEYLEGQTLQQLLRRANDSNGLSPYVAVHIAIEVLTALRFAHNATDHRGVPNEIVHRDISPQNIFVTNAGQVKVLDFGIAKARCHEQRTSTGIVKGKFAYIAPEQASGHTVDARADVWSLGVVLWEMLAGKRLFKADGEAATLNATLNREIPFLSKLRPEIPSDLSLCVARSLQRDQAKRYANAEAMIADLEQYLARSRSRPDSVTLAEVMRQQFCDEMQLQQQLVSDLIVLHQTQSTAGEVGSPPSATGTAVTAESATSLGPETQAMLVRLRRTNRLALATLIGLMTCLVAASLLLLESRHRHAPPTPDPTAAPAADRLPLAPANRVTKPDSEALEGSPPGPSELDFANPVASVEPTLERVPVKTVSPSAKSRPAPRVALSSPAPSIEHQTAPIEYGYVTIDTTPWSNVFWKGKPLGQTPLVKVRLPNGAQTLTLRNPDLDVEMQYTINVIADQTTVKRLGLK